MIRNFFSSFRAALAFLTRIPVGHGEISASAQAGIAGQFPIVGTMLGLMGCLVWLACARLSADVRAWLVVAISLLTTGAFHEDGLADTADALGGAFTRTRLFEILKDSRIGTFGGAALICTLALRAKLLAELLPKNLGYLVAAQTFSRLAPVVLMASLPYVTPEGKSRSQNVTRAGASEVVCASSWIAVVSVVLFYGAHVSLLQLGAASVAQALMVLVLAFRFKRRAGGITGDFLGATQQLGELAFLLGIAFTCTSLP